MNHETIKNDDMIQLKQMIIFLKAELIKYETMDSIAEMNRLKKENYQLLKENETLQKEIQNKTQPIQESATQLVAVNEKLAQLMELVKINKTEQQNIDQLLIKVIEKEAIIADYEKQVKKLKEKLMKLAQENEEMALEFQKISPELVHQMDLQMKEVLQKSLDYAKQVDEKLEMIGQIEQKLIEATNLKNSESAHFNN